MTHYKWLVIERYPDGGTWRHMFVNERDARWVIEDMQEAHKGRKYVLSALPDDPEPTK
jgi:hypothetical protein